MRRRSRDERIEASADRLTGEWEAVLAGRYVEHLGARHDPVPPWAWVNVLAHATEEELGALARGRSRPGRLKGFDDWYRALEFLADDILRHLRTTGGSLTQLQRSVLIPLEFDLYGRSDDVRHPGRLAGIVLAAVHRHPSTNDVR